jgi:peptidoglycan/xylan/chitin deacetylase (PgdA/CDA1 family)
MLQGSDWPVERSPSRALRLIALATLVLAATPSAAQDSEPPAPNSIPVAFTLDDLGTTGAEPVEKIAKALREAGVPEAYGFLIGSRAMDDRDNEESVRVWVRSGYQIGNHTFSHKELSEVSAAFFEKDILANELPLREFAPPGENWHWFRYPNLSEGDTMAKKEDVRAFLAGMPTGQNYRIAEVTVDYADWLFDAAYGRCLKQGQLDRVDWLKQLYLHKATYSLIEARDNARKLFGRDIPQIFLVHYSNFTGEVMADLLAALKANGARFITLEEAQSDPVFDTDSGIALPHGENFLNTRLFARFPPVEDNAPARMSAWKAKVNAACAEETERVVP